MPIAGCWKPGLIALGIVTTLLTGFATVGSDHAACPPVVEYPTALREQAAAEIDALPPGAVIEGMLADYHVLRRQVAVCSIT